MEIEWKGGRHRLREGFLRKFWIAAHTLKEEHSQSSCTLFIRHGACFLDGISSTREVSGAATALSDDKPFILYQAHDTNKLAQISALLVRQNR
jgi:hypothetical protein